jgi:amidase
MSSPSAFVAEFDLAPTGSGPLDGLTFAIKDVIDVAGHVTGCGNPDWARTHGPASRHASCVEHLLTAGARAKGKTVTDELAFSLLGENHWFGTPLNPKAPDHVPGGSSCGSVSAVAQGLVDFALGTDTGGSVRVPASNCGIFGFRPTHGRIALDGINPLAPSFDTVGLFAREARVLRAAATVLLGKDPVSTPVRVLLLDDAFELADPEVCDAILPAIDELAASLGVKPSPVQLKDFIPEFSDLRFWRTIYSELQGIEIWSQLGPWIEETKPAFGDQIAGSFKLARSFDPARLSEFQARRERVALALNHLMRPGTLLCLPTAPTPAPKKGSISPDRTQGDYYPRALAMTSLAGIGRLPQISIPAGPTAENLPIGLSVIATSSSDATLLNLIK